MDFFYSPLQGNITFVKLPSRARRTASDVLLSNNKRITLKGDIDNRNRVLLYFSTITLLIRISCNRKLSLLLFFVPNISFDIPSIFLWYTLDCHTLLLSGCILPLNKWYIINLNYSDFYSVKSKNAPFFVSNHTLHNDFHIKTTIDEAITFYNRFYSKILNHYIPLIKGSFQLFMGIPVIG